MSKAHISEVWTYFAIDNAKNGKCKLNDKKYSWHIWILLQFFFQKHSHRFLQMWLLKSIGIFATSLLRARFKLGVKKHKEDSINSNFLSSMTLEF